MSGVFDPVHAGQALLEGGVDPICMHIEKSISFQMWFRKIRSLDMLQAVTVKYPHNAR